jgi:hypothetical protein
MLRQRKLMKSKFKLAGDKFNIKPLKSEWIRFAIEIGILKPIDANSRMDQERCVNLAINIDLTIFLF